MELLLYCWNEGWKMVSEHGTLWVASLFLWLACRQMVNFVYFCMKFQKPNRI